MYRILVVDDEELIRQGIKYLFDYEALGFTICGEAATGPEALAQIRSLQPDVVLMDIRMPGMTGLEVAEIVRQEGYTSRIAIISSYTDFSYAREAMRYGVQHYITKPIDEDELQEILCTFREELDQENRATSISEHYRSKAHYSIVRDILEGNATPQGQALQDMNMEADIFCVALCQQYGDRELNPHELFTQLICLPNQDNCAYDHITLHGSEVYLLKGSHVIHRLLERSLNCRNEQLSSLFIGLGRPVASLQQVRLSYEDTQKLKSRRFFCPKDSYIMDQTALEMIEATAAFISNEQMQRLSVKILDYIQSFNRKGLWDTMDWLQAQLRVTSDSVDSVKLFLAALYLQIKNQINHLYPNEQMQLSVNADIIADIEKSRYLYAVIDLLQQQFERIMAAIGTSTRDSVLDEILNYIHHNYANNITLESIAPLFGYNRSYLGKIFSKKMGQNFNSYLDQIRIEHSKELLLRDEAKVYAIAARVGYKNVDYFHIKFKKLTGMSPAEFRRAGKDPSCSQNENTEKGTLFESK